jgi:hypothetical protein
MKDLERCISLVMLVTAGGCVYDTSERCGPAMELDATLDVCVCAPNAVVTGLGCTACTVDEVVVNGACGCAPGSTKNSDNVCARVAGLGDSCDSATPCTDAKYSFCAPTTGGVATSNTCTQACSSDADCDSAYTCATWETQPYCREFEGVGKTCSSAADCAGTDAMFCDTFQSHTCIVNGCSLSANECPKGTMCCDFSSFGLGTLCAEACQ